MDVVRLVVAWRLPQLVEGMARAMSEQEGIEVVGTALDSSETVEVVGETIPDVLLMNVELPGVGGPAVIARMSSEYPSVGVVVLCNLPGSELVPAAVDNGARGALMVDGSLRELVNAVRLVASGRTYIAPFLVHLCSRPGD
jgi:DNA-binding NarL/FixJ family response regulator